MNTLINGACRATTEIESSESDSVPEPPYVLPTFAASLEMNVYTMICVKSMVKTSGEPSEHLVTEEDLQEPCLLHDILCGNRTHPLVVKTT